MKQTQFCGIPRVVPQIKGEIPCFRHVFCVGVLFLTRKTRKFRPSFQSTRHRGGCHQRLESKCEAIVHPEDLRDNLQNDDVDIVEAKIRLIICREGKLSKIKMKTYRVRLNEGFVFNSTKSASASILGILINTHKPT